MKLAQGVLVCTLITLSFVSNGQNSVGIGVANPNKNAVLELISPGNNQGLLIPKLTTAQRTAASFTNNLTTKENGLLVFDGEENKFYYWAATAWKEMGTSTLVSGDGITIVNNTVSVIPQDLELTGNTLKITGNPSGTSIDLSPFAGSNTDDQVLTYDGATGQLSISRITGGPQAVTLTTSGTAGGDLTGAYPNPTVAGNAITSAKIADNTVTTNDILDGTVASVDIATGGVASIDILDQAIAAADLADNSVQNNHILDGTIGTADIATGGVASVDILDATIVSADIFDGTITSADIADNSIASADVLDGTIASADIADGTIVSADIFDGTVALADLAANSVNSSKIVDASVSNADISDLNVGKLSVGTNGQVLTTSGGVAGWGNPSGTTLINDVGTRNLFAGNPVGGPGAGSADNTYYGWSAGVSTPTVTGSGNVAIGSQAGQNIAGGGLNVLIGWRAGFTGTGAFNGNTFIGAQAGQLSTGGPNTFIGEKAGQITDTGTQNVFIGNSAGISNQNGGQNTIIGYAANVSAAGLQNATAVGYAAVVDANNKVRIGNTSITVIQGQVNFTAISDRRLKTNITPIAYGLDFVMKLKPVSYNMKNLSDTRLNWGFIAQDIESLVGETNSVLTIGADKDRTLGLRYSDFVAPLVKAVQEQQDQISDLNNKLNESERKYEELAAELEQIKKAIGLKANK